jgi:archaellum component FlaF (FlaF/FlaG flagellin family)
MAAGAAIFISAIILFGYILFEWYKNTPNRLKGRKEKILKKRSNLGEFDNNSFKAGEKKWK